MSTVEHFCRLAPVTMNRADLKQRVAKEIDHNRELCVALSQRIHANPELGHEEEQASAWLAESLADEGFTVEGGISDLPTAFRARKGDGRLNIALCAEYDALPGVGHACGHNMIAAAAVAASLGLRSILDEVDLTITVMGTPAEEVINHGGKILMLERGAFDGVHAAMMVHPAPFEAVRPTMIAAAGFNISYVGREAHASAAPEMGVNAADAAVIAQVAIGLLRQHLPKNSRVHGIVDRAGEAPNIVPAAAYARYMVRAPEIGELLTLQTRVLKCFEAGALATGATMHVEGGDRPYADVEHDPILSELYRSNGAALGRVFHDEDPQFAHFQASTDMGNISAVIPSIHPFFGVGTWPVVNHQPEFAAFCATPEADDALITAATSLAWTAVDMVCDDGIREALIER
jgi:amidohydrolase